MPTDSRLADMDAESGDYQSFPPPIGDIEIRMHHRRADAHDDEFGISLPAPLPDDGDDDLDNETFDSPCGACQGRPGALVEVDRRSGRGAGPLPEPAGARQRRQPPKLAKAQRRTKRRAAACEVDKLTQTDSQRIRAWKIRTIAVAAGLGLIASLSLYFVVARQGGATSNELTVLVARTRDESTKVLSRQLESVGEEMAQLVAATALTTNSSLLNVTVDLWDDQTTQYRNEYPFVEWIGWTKLKGEADGSHSWQASPPFLHGADVSTVLASAVIEGIREATDGGEGPFLTRTILGLSPDMARELENPARRSFWIQPIQRDDESDSVAGLVALLLNWDAIVEEVMPAPSVNTSATSAGVVVQNKCGDVLTYHQGSNRTRFVGEGDRHDVPGDGLRNAVPFGPSFQGGVDNITGSEHVCEYSFVFYGSVNSSSTSTSTTLAIVFAVTAAVVSLIVTLAFFQYDLYASRQNRVIEATAKQESALLASLFPANVAKRLFAEEKQKTTLFFNTKNRVKCYLDERGDGNVTNNNKKKGRELRIHRFVGKPIAELFPETTIMFADISGFTSWSSTRNPEAVLRLLECIYRAFDMIAKAQRVYKVETIGDSYVAVAGLPDPRRDHAVAMARFARDIMAKMKGLVRKLEVVLGPDTADLQLRIGLHSGSVTGGVLRGDRARFQLFGDAMNTASRMVSTSQPGKVQLSQETTDLLIAAGKFQWIELRESTVVAKGKGELQTYWLTLTDSSIENAEDLGYHPADVGLDLGSEMCGSRSNASGRMDRLISWNTECLLKLLRQVVAKRESFGGSTTGNITTNERRFTRSGETVIHEVKEVITLPANKTTPTDDPSQANAASMSQVIDPDEVEFSVEAVDQMYDFVSNVAAMYKPENPFHNFEHASNVVMALMKFFAKIEANAGTVDENGVDCTLGIAAEPLTRFACVFAALIRDVDHAGVPNSQLVKEQAPIAVFYKGRCPAEQNAVDLAWQMLTDDAYIDLRELIYTNDDELQLFRSVVVNGVLATDLLDAELKRDRTARWSRAFSPSPTLKAKSRASNGSSSIGSVTTGENLASRDELTNRKATVVLEYLVQASEVSHAMQPWHVYRKWDEHAFLERYKAYMEGRADNVDPVATWYEGEMASFDFVVIPLAKKLRDSGVFGTSGDEYLNLALRNRAEWEDRGREVLSEMSNLARRTYEM